ncbi:MAG: hypothetical protein HC913_13140 [Microscillaceae bacterium]|nr:hypothetical protein [Microscillaceae bacterium]
MKSIIFALFIVCSTFGFALSNTGEVKPLPNKKIFGLSEMVQTNFTFKQTYCECSESKISQEPDDVEIEVCIKFGAVTNCTTVILKSDKATGKIRIDL